MNRPNPRRFGIKGLPKRQNLYLVHSDLMKKMAGSRGFSWFVDELIEREYRRRVKRQANDTISK